MIGSSLLMASFGFMVHSVTPAMADSNIEKMNANSNYKMVPTNADGSINVKLSDEQLDKIIPKNADGSINVLLTDKQVKMMAPPAIQSINIEQIRGRLAGCTTNGNWTGLDVVPGTLRGTAVYP